MPNPREERKRGSIQSIDRATAILKALASGPRRLGVSELADRLGLARPTVHGLLQTLQSHGSALGKAVLAFSPAQVLEDLLAEPLPRLTKQTVNQADLQRELEIIRDSGVATEREEAVLGESSAAAPIFDHGGHAVGAIGVVDSTDRIFPRGLARGLSAALGEAARGVSREPGAPRRPYAAEARRCPSGPCVGLTAPSRS